MEEAGLAALVASLETEAVAKAKALHEQVSRLDQAQRELAAASKKKEEVWMEQRKKLEEEKKQALLKSDLIAKEHSAVEKSAEAIRLAGQDTAQKQLKQITELRQNLDKKTLDVDAIQRQNHDLKQRLQEAKAAAEEALKTSASSTKKANDNAAALAAAVEKNKELQQKANESQALRDAEHVRLLSEKQQAAQATAQAAKSKQALEEQLVSLKAKLAKQTQELEAAKENLKRQQREASEAAHRAEQDSARRGSVQSELETAREQLRVNKNVIAELQDKVAGLEKAVSAQASQEQSRTSELSSKDFQVADLQAQLREAVSDRDKLNGERLALKKEAESLRKEKAVLLVGPCARCKDKQLVQKENEPVLAPTSGGVHPPPRTFTPRQESKDVKGPKLVGVGMRLTDEFPHTVAEFVRGGAAKRSGLIQVGDHLLAVDGRDIQKLPISEIAAMIVGQVRVSYLLRACASSPRACGVVRDVSCAFFPLAGRKRVAPGFQAGGREVRGEPCARHLSRIVWECRSDTCVDPPAGRVWRGDIAVGKTKMGKALSSYSTECDRRRANRFQHSFRPGSTTHTPGHLALELHTNLTDQTQNDVGKHSRPAWQLANLTSRPGPRNHLPLACLTVSCTSVSTNSPRPWRAGAARLVLATWPLLPPQWHLPACKSATQQGLQPRR